MIRLLLFATWLSMVALPALADAPLFSLVQTPPGASLSVIARHLSDVECGKRVVQLYSEEIPENTRPADIGMLKIVKYECRIEAD